MALIFAEFRPDKQVAEAAGRQNEKSLMRALKGWTELSA